MNNPPTRSQIYSLVAGYVLDQLGFQVASETIIPHILSKIIPGGQTAFRDSLTKGCDLLIKLSQILQDTETAKNWNFTHILIVNGQDKHSQIQSETLLKNMSRFHQLLHIKTHNTIIVGFEVSLQVEKELQNIVKAAGQSSQYYSTNQNEFVTLIQKIAFLSGVRDKKENQFHTVMFNVEAGNSMLGQKWMNICRGVNLFASYLGQSDLLSAIVFNSHPKLVATMSTQDELFRISQEVSSIMKLKPISVYSNKSQPKKKLLPRPKQQQKLKQKSQACRCIIM